MTQQAALCILVYEISYKFDRLTASGRTSHYFHQKAYGVILEKVEIYYFAVFRLNSSQRANEIAVRNNSCGVDLFAL